MQTFLEFEKPIAELEGKIKELRHLSDAGDINIADEVARMQSKVDRLLRSTYERLTPARKVQVARHPNRPQFSDHVAALIYDFTPLAGDRPFADERAIQGGLGRVRGRPDGLLGQETGADPEHSRRHHC